MMSNGRCAVHSLGWILMVIGAVNWGLVGLFEWNLVEKIFGGWPLVVKIAYVFVGVSGVLALLEGNCKSCKTCEKK